MVEFFDYQCPPCRSASKRMKDILGRCNKPVVLAFRNLPLNIHPNAMFAATAAEAAREQDKFEEIHAELLQVDNLSWENIQQLVHNHGLDTDKFNRDCKAVALKRVKEDLVAAKRLKLRGTPSFLICKPDKTVVLLGDLSQLPEIVNKG